MLIEAAKFVETVDFFLLFFAFSHQKIFWQLHTDTLTPMQESQMDSLPCRLVHYLKTLSLIAAWSKVYLLPTVASFMEQELARRVTTLGIRNAPRAFGMAMSTEVTHRVESEDDILFGDLISVLMRYFAHLFGPELGPDLQASFL